jgi:hypothetical protein
MYVFINLPDFIRRDQQPTQERILNSPFATFHFLSEENPCGVSHLPIASHAGHNFFF